MSLTQALDFYFRILAGQKQLLESPNSKHTKVAQDMSTLVRIREIVATMTAL